MFFFLMIFFFCDFCCDMFFVKFVVFNKYFICIVFCSNDFGNKNIFNVCFYCFFIEKWVFCFFINFNIYFFKKFMVRMIVCYGKYKIIFNGDEFFFIGVEYNFIFGDFFDISVKFYMDCIVFDE